MNCLTSGLRFLLGGLALVASMGAQAQAYPSKPIRLIVPYPAGGATDGLARHVSGPLQERLGQSVVVDNKPGGATTIAAAALISAPADGYTVAIFDPSTVSMNQFLFKRPPYDPAKSIQPITVLTRIPFAIMTQPSFPANSLAEFVAYAKAKPDLSFGSSGAGNPVHLAMEQFKNVSGLAMTHIPYKGGAPAIQDLLGGQLPVLMMDIPSAMPHIRAGKIKVIAITSAARSELLPNVPTIAESGFPGFEAGSWFGAFVPAGTPPAVSNKLLATFTDIMSSTPTKDWTKSMTLEATTGTTEQFQKLIASDAEKYGKLIKQLGLSLDN